MKNKKGIEIEVLGWWIMAIVVLVIILLAGIILINKGQGGLSYFRELFRFGK
ncbi:MAG: hypothetical protein QXI33_00575 [Candidatus Pacearchaeota archaeon]